MAVADGTLTGLLKLLSDPTRLRILGLIEHEELAVGELSRALSMAQSRVSNHLRLLRDGGLVDSPALIDALKSGQLGHLGLDVYEEEADLFFEDRSADVLQDDVLARLLSFPNVIVTAHQAFFTREALAGIADTTLANVAAWAAGAPVNVVQA